MKVHSNKNITYTKAVGIILMVLCHAMFWDIPFVYMFHMPLFFFVSGYCFKERYAQEPFKFVWQRIKGIYWPYVKWSLLFLLLHNVFCNLNIYDKSVLYSIQDVLPVIKRILIKMDGHEQLLAGYWFLKSLFYGSIIFFAVIVISKFCTRLRDIAVARVSYLTNVKIRGVALLVALLLLIYYDFSMKALSQAVLAAIFILLGYLFKSLNVRTFSKAKISLTFILVGTGSVIWNMAMHALPYDIYRVIPYILTAAIATWSIYSLPWYRVKGVIANALQFIGNNTITILTWHFLSFKLVSLFIIYIYDLPIERLAEHPVIIEYSAKGWWIVYFIVSMTICSAIAYCNKYIKSSWLKL